MRELTMHGRRELMLLAGAGALAGLFPAGAEAATGADDPALIEAARAEGALNTIALTPTWANFAAIMATFQKNYGIPLHNAAPDDTSAQELQSIRSTKGQARAPDTVDVGLSFALIGAAEGLFRPYKVATWDSIPDDMKDPGGLWRGDYFGLISFGVNRSVVKTPPVTWADLKKPAFKGMVALNGNPLGANAAFAAVMAAAIGNGGSLDDIMPGIEFFAELSRLGNFSPVAATAESSATGQTPVVIDWDYLNLDHAKAARRMVEIDTIIPEGAKPFGAFYCQAISKYAPHPRAADLWEEFLFSDQVQILLLQGFAHPARFADLVRRGVIPKSLMADLPPPGPYSEALFANSEQSRKAQAALAAHWARMVKL